MIEIGNDPQVELVLRGNGGEVFWASARSLPNGFRRDLIHATDRAATLAAEMVDLLRNDLRVLRESDDLRTQVRLSRALLRLADNEAPFSDEHAL